MEISLISLNCFLSEVKALNAYAVLNVPPTATKAEIRAAYRALARRWHPDRFMEGPERDWANEKMAEINAAYRACLREPTQCADAEEEGRALRRNEELIDGGQYPLARRKLMDIATRCAEWNYLFGAVLMKTSEVQKALIYLSVAAHQQPDNQKYARALQEAQSAQQGARRGLAARLRRR